MADEEQDSLDYAKQLLDSSEKLDPVSVEVAKLAALIAIADRLDNIQMQIRRSGNK